MNTSTLLQNSIYEYIPYVDNVPRRRSIIRMPALRELRRLVTRFGLPAEQEMSTPVHDDNKPFNNVLFEKQRTLPIYRVTTCSSLAPCAISRVSYR